MTDPDVFELALRRTDGTVVVVPVPLGPDWQLAGYELRVGGQPVVAAGFALHDDSRRYHTICRRRSPEIDEVEL